MLLSKVSDCFQTGFTWASWFQLVFNCMTVWNHLETLESKAWRASIRLATIEIDPFDKEQREYSSEINCVRTGIRKRGCRYGCNWFQVDFNYIMSVESNLVYCSSWSSSGTLLNSAYLLHTAIIRLILVKPCRWAVYWPYTADMLSSGRFQLPFLLYTASIRLILVKP